MSYLESLDQKRGARKRLSVIVLTLNEELHLPRLLERLRRLDLIEDVTIVDSYSADNTLKIAETAGVRIIQNTFVSQADQLQWALDNIRFDGDWLIRLDADELIDEDLIKNLENVIEASDKDASIVGVELNRRHIFMGKWIKHGGRYPLWILRAWKNGFATTDGRAMDEHMVLTSGRTVKINGTFEDHNLAGLKHFSEKHVLYATREVSASLHDSRKLTTGQASRKRFLKKVVYARMPSFWGPLAYFLFRYFVRLGFLDGVPGYYYHLFQALWYRSLVEALRLERQAAPAEPTGSESVVE